MANSPKTVPGSASVSAVIESLDDAQRRADCHDLLALMQAATGEAPALWRNASRRSPPPKP